MKDIRKIIKSEYKFTETNDYNKLKWYLDYELIKRDLEKLNNAYSKGKKARTLKRSFDLLTSELNALGRSNFEFKDCNPLIDFLTDINHKRNEVAHSFMMYELDENGYDKLELIKWVLRGALIELPCPLA